MRCEFKGCPNEEELPYACPRCLKAFCRDHAPPEAHNCKPPKFETPGADYPMQSEKQKVGETSRQEVRNITVAWAALGVAFGAVLFGRSNILLGVAVSLVAVGAGFILHELAHKFVAQKFGCWAEFRMWKNGLLLVLGLAALSFASGFPLPLFAAPGATYISGYLGKRREGLVSLAGPMTNVAIAFGFLGLSAFQGIAGLVGSVGFSINIFLALFNLIPFSMLDGKKVFRWNKAIWAAAFFPLLALLVLAFTGL